ncbi:MAG TPA: TonB family protein [Blastocatellia bacterium]|nr:TonB family protein [Blastocatellia bacterium]
MKWLILLATLLSSLNATLFAQSPVVTLRQRDDQIGLIRTAQGISTRLVFSEEIRDIVCGDLYDPNSGRGGFVVQRVGNDVFLKPVVSKGTSNLFVKTGEKGEMTFSFDLIIVPVEQAHRVVKVINANPPAAIPAAIRNTARVAFKHISPPMSRLLDFPDTRAVPMFAVPAIAEASEAVRGPLPSRVPALTEYENPAPSVGATIADNSKRKVINQVVPVYPEEARRARAAGPVTIEVTISPNGAVTAARAVSGNALLTASALAAARRWVFAPRKAGESLQDEVTRILFYFGST